MPGKEVERRYRGGKQRSPNEQRAEALEVLRLKRNGWLDVQIAQEIGCSIPTVKKRLTQALAEHGESTAAEYREVISQQLDVLYQACMPGVSEQDPMMINTALRIADRKAKLLGVDAPVKVDVQVTEVTAQERELQDLLDQAARAEKARESVLIEGEVVE